ncbi:16S rRNA (cytidine(1402)-2'-O)-methyltransferase [Oribacterium sp. oral taxon 102]|uniref:16S rRNA (cytidine(1402)-2'-O)-methyltransferase n=1 Tax=Oribacterium sp. oral taxon 102 TaxID=671214 RepID=UPI0015C1AD12|nr:16S rRNA (cytidine(1402)-2'-O)-methyltransferase [Oribacterium sp. oral taxon 102]NWO22234.1 16S rRNA (cytidine(1402)-2'-O)-methyltransferase [Oribacterium sp. oral taxon 102]
METGTLYICATPIGNLEDITLRVLRCLREADLIAAEDTRNSLRLLNHFEIRTPMTAYHEFNKYDKARALVQELLRGKNIAIITDAGTPCISDPGEELVRQAAEAGVPITSLPGPAAVVTALTLSGLSTRRFAFEAFLPQDKKERARILAELREESRTILLYEAPHHLRQTLRELSDVLGGTRRLTLCRELTKRHEEVLRTTLTEAVERYRIEEPRGEYVLALEGKSLRERRAEAIRSWENVPLCEHIERYRSQGMSEMDAMKAAAKDRGVSKREIYKEWKSRRA